MSVEITDVEIRDGYRLFLRFDDGSAGEMDISDVVSFDGVFAPLADATFFAQVTVDRDWGTLRWPNDVDLAPEPLYERITGRNPLSAGRSEPLRAADVLKPR